MTKKAIHKFFQKSPALALKRVFAAVALTAAISSVQATPFTVGGNTYDITIQNLTPNQTSAQVILMSTPWWGNSQLAFDLSAAVSNSLGVGSSWYNSGFAPWFVHDGYFPGGWFGAAVWSGGSTSFTAPGGIDYINQPFAVGTLIAGPTPPTGVPDASTTAGLFGLALLGLLAVRRRFTR
jgi:L-asparagine transporter-like permease